MRRHRRNRATPNEDYGPVTDLVFSMFAVSVLLIGILGTDGQVKQAALDRLIGSTAGQRDLSPLLVAPSATVPAAIAETLTTERDAARLEAQAAQARAADLEADLRRLRSAAGFRLELGTLPIPLDSAALSGGPLEAAFVERLRVLVAAHADGIRSVEANRLSFEINVAAHLGEASSDGDRDYLGSLSMALALDEALRRSPLPFNCLAAIPLGKSRSSAVAPLAVGPEPGRSLDRFDAAGGSDLSETTARLRELAPEDSRLRVVAETVASESCDPTGLADAIDRWAGSGP